MSQPLRTTIELPDDAPLHPNAPADRWLCPSCHETLLGPADSGRSNRSRGTFAALVRSSSAMVGLGQIIPVLLYYSINAERGRSEHWWGILSPSDRHDRFSLPRDG